MATVTDDSPTKKIKTIDFSLCFVCQDTHPVWKLVPPSKPETLANLLKSFETRIQHGENIYTQRLADLRNVTFDELIKTFKGQWHLECYKDKTNKTNIERVKKRYAKMNKTADIPTVVNVTPGRPSKAQGSNENQGSSPVTRPKRDKHFSKDLCVLCQSKIDGVPLHEVKTKNMTSQLTDIARNTRNEKVRCRRRNWWYDI